MPQGARYEVGGGGVGIMEAKGPLGKKGIGEGKLDKYSVIGGVRGGGTEGSREGRKKEKKEDELKAHT